MRLRTVRWAVKVTVATASVVLMTAALAFAGVDLPGTAAETAFQKVLGVDLPNQAEEHADAVPAGLPESASETAVAVLDVIREWRSGAEWNGCEFGARVSAVAQGLEGEPDTLHCASAGGGTDGAGGSAGAGSENASHAEEGLETADTASGGVASNGAANADAGLETAGEASGGGGSGGGDNADAGLGNADGGLDTADESTDGMVGGPNGGPGA